jgi:amidase
VNLNEFADATALAEQIRAGKVSSVEAFEASWQAIETLNPALAAVCFKDFQLGLTQAQALDSEFARMPIDDRQQLEKTRPFFGVPSLMKDLGTAAIGLPSQMGSRAVNVGIGAVQWAVDAELVARYRRAGLNLFGRTTSPEFGISASTEARAYDFLGGPTRNPYLQTHSAGGSSGGAAAAVASGMVLIANASDGAGSIRIPASCCGLYGLKPSRGLMPAGPFIGESWGGLATEHVLTRSVRDSLAMLLATAGSDVGAPYAAPVLKPADKGPLRIAFCATTFDGDPIHAEVALAVRQVAIQLAALGHHVEEVRPPVNTFEVINAVVRLMACGTAMTVNRWGYSAQLEALLEPSTQGAVALGRATSAADYLELLNRLHRITREVAKFHEKYDLMLCPTLAEPPAELGRFAMNNADYLDYRLGEKGVWKYSPFTPLANATGQPSMSLPAGLSSSGLPIGVMLTGRLGEDLTVLHAATALRLLEPQM